MRRTAALILVTLLALACRGIRSSPPRGHAAADSVLSLIRTKGARAAFDTMARDPATEERWTDSIATGDSAWLLVATTLRPASDAGDSEGLDVTLGLALPNAPEGVLRALRKAPFDREVVCGSPFWEGTPDSTVDNHHRHAVAALRAVRAPDLASARDSCLRILLRD